VLCGSFKGPWIRVGLGIRDKPTAPFSPWHVRPL